MLLRSQWEHSANTRDTLHHEERIRINICQFVTENVQQIIDWFSFTSRNSGSKFLRPPSEAPLFSFTGICLLLFQVECRVCVSNQWVEKCCCVKVFGLWSSHPGSVQSHLNCDGVQTGCTVWGVSQSQSQSQSQPSLSLSLQSSRCFQTAAACCARALPTPATEARTRRGHSDRRDPSGPGGVLGPAPGPGAG